MFGWTFDTTITISRLIFAGIYDRHPNLKLIAHHGGGLIPHFSGRVGMMPAFGDLDASGSLGQALERLKKKPIEYFRMLYVDTAMFGGEHGVKPVVDFFGPDRVLFGTDTPFDAQAGSYFIPRTTAKRLVLAHTAQAATASCRCDRTMPSERSQRSASVPKSLPLCRRAAREPSRMQLVLGRCRRGPLSASLRAAAPKRLHSDLRRPGRG